MSDQTQETTALEMPHIKAALTAGITEIDNVTTFLCASPLIRCDIISRASRLLQQENQHVTTQSRQ
jgi:hypothetical protein